MRGERVRVDLWGILMAAGRCAGGVSFLFFNVHSSRGEDLDIEILSGLWVEKSVL